MAFGEIARGFGIEIEFKGHLDDALSALSAAGISVRHEGYNHRTSPRWKIVTDASVPGGGELVSPILRGEDGLAEACRAMAALAGAGMRVDKDCGLHVHLDASGMTLRRMKNLAKFYAKYEDAIDSLMPRSRRRDHGYYCKSLVPAMLAATTDEEYKAAVDAFFAKIDACQSLEQVQQSIPGVRGRERNLAKLNVGAYWRHGTIEFRHHSGTLNPNRLASWVRFCDGFYTAACKATRIAPRRADGRKGAELLGSLCKDVVDGAQLRTLRHRATMFTPTGILRRSAASAEA